jgi:hypothetical protein
LTGSWLSHISFDGAKYWERDATWVREVPLESVKTEPLPSDCRFREDLVALKAGDEETAQREKTRIEEDQRRDRKLRAAAVAKQR